VPDAGAVEYKLLKEFVDSHNPGRSIGIMYSLNGKTEVGMGDDIFFNAVLRGYEGLVLNVQWQYTVNGTDWSNIPGASSPAYRLTVTESTIDWTVRVNVMISGGEGFNVPVAEQPAEPAEETPAQPEESAPAAEGTPAESATEQSRPAAEPAPAQEEVAAPAPEQGAAAPAVEAPPAQEGAEG